MNTKNNMSIKDILKEANRYEEVINILNDIISKNDTSSLPVDPYIAENGETKWRVCGKLVIEEAIDLFQLIYKESTITDFSFESFYNLYQYIHSETNRLLHNYAVCVSHRNEPYIKMDDIRAWIILDNLLVNFSINDDDDCYWDIPDGWKKLKTENKNKIVVKEKVDVTKLINTFTDMANRESLLVRDNVSQQDLLMQIIGTIVHVAMETE